MSDKKETTGRGRKKKPVGSTDPKLLDASVLSVTESISSVLDTPIVEVIGPPVPSPATSKELEVRDDIKDLDVAKKMLKINQSANDRGLAFDLSFNTVKRLMSYKKCYYTGKEFKEDGPFGRSFDRVDSSKGYVEGNVVACTVDINGKKSNLSNEEIILLYEKLILKK